MSAIRLKFGAYVEIEAGRVDDRRVSVANIRPTAPGTAIGNDDVDALMGLAKLYASMSGELMAKARDVALEVEQAGSGRLFGGFDTEGKQLWLDSGNWMPERSHAIAAYASRPKSYHRTGKIGRLRVKDRNLGGTIGEPIAEYESSDKARIWINLDGEIVAENA